MNITLRLVEGRVRRSKYKSSIVVNVDLIRLAWCTSLLAKFSKIKKLLKVKALEQNIKKS